MRLKKIILSTLFSVLTFTGFITVEATDFADVSISEIMNGALSNSEYPRHFVRYKTDDGGIVIAEIDAETNEISTRNDLVGYNISPSPGISVNGSNGPLSISFGTPVSVTVTLNPGDYAAQNADWWVAELTPSGTYNHFDLSTSSMVEGLLPTHQGPLFNLGAMLLLNSSNLTVGIHTFYFAVDMEMNGSLDFDELYYDSVAVNIIDEPNSGDLTGNYSGSLDATATECFPGGEDDAFTLSGTITVSSPSRVGEMFNASGALSIQRYGFYFTMHFIFSGMATVEGELSGTYTETFAGTNGFHSSGNGTFTGVAAGDAISLEIAGQDTDVFGDTCAIQGVFAGAR